MKELLNFTNFKDFESASRAVLNFLHNRIGFKLWMMTKTVGDDWIVLHIEDFYYGVKEGTVFNWKDSFCSKMVKGLGPNIAVNSNEVLIYKNSEISKKVDIKAYIGIPVYENDGSLFGTLCAIDPEIQSKEIEEELPLINILGKLLSSFLLQDELNSNLENSLKKERVERESKEQFFANMSHEIRTPLSGILTSLDILKEQVKSENERKYVNICFNSSQHLLSIVNEILDINKLQSGKFDLDIKEVNIKEELLKLKELFSIDISRRNLYLNFFVDERIPELLYLDLKRLNQILMNLINNSIKFTKEGGIILNVKIKGKKKKSICLVFEVKDTGKGIAKENIAKIFEPYAQEDSTIATRYGGTGLGTYITKKLVDLFGGKISIKSELEVGTEIYVEMKFKIPKKIRELEETKNKIYKFEEQLILLVDDNLINRELIGHLIKSMNLKVKTVRSGKEAYKFYKSNYKYIKMILMDINMPDMNGIDATKIIRDFEDKNNLNKIPIVALTANTINEIEYDYHKLGMNNYLSKPVEKERLNKLFKSYIN